MIKTKINKIAGIMLATCIGLNASSIPVMAEETTTTTSTEESTTDTNRTTSDTDSEATREQGDRWIDDGVGDTTERRYIDFRHYKREIVRSSNIPWNFGSSVVGSSVTEGDIFTFVPDSWLLTWAIDMFSKPPLSWLFLDQTKNAATLRGLFSSHLGIDYQHYFCSADWPEEEIAKYGIHHQFCNLGYSSNPIDRLRILANTVTSS